MTESCLIVLDRDGIINVDYGHVHSIERFVFVEGVFDFCKEALSRGCKLAIATNQAGIARGLYSQEEFIKLSDWMLGVFAEKGIEFIGVFFCPHHPEYGQRVNCTCRKPQAGLLTEASNRAGIGPESCIMIGDKDTDIQAANNAGFRYSVRIGERNEMANFCFKSVAVLAAWSQENWFF